jgi:Cu/Ag efflux protein CusF
MVSTAGERGFDLKGVQIDIHDAKIYTCNVAMTMRFKSSHGAEFEELKPVRS